MKQFFIAIALIGLLATPHAAHGIDLGGSRAEEAASAAGFSKDTGPTTLAATIGTVVKAALSLIGVIFMILIIYAGFLWMTARGNEAQIEKAQSLIRAAVIGLIIVLGAYSITSFIVPRLIARTTGGGGGGGGGTVSGGCCSWSTQTGTRTNGSPIFTPGSRQVDDDNFCQATCRDNNAAPGTCSFASGGSC